MTDQSEPATKQYRTRLSVLFAADAPVAVVLRRGPKRHWHLATWDLRNDTFVHGQWMKGGISLCDLTPNGKKLIYFASQYHNPRRPEDRQPFDPLAVTELPRQRKGRKVPRYVRQRVPPKHHAQIHDTWTAISTPPFFTALAVWPAFGTWTGGGFFSSDTGAYIGEPEDRMIPIERVPIPTRFHFHSAHGLLPAMFKALRPSASYPSLGADLQEGPYWEGLRASGVQWVDWMHERSARQLLFSCDGRIYRLHGWKTIEPKRFLEEAELVADFNGLTFQRLAAPSEAMRW